MNDFLHKKRKQKKYIRINLACGRGRYVRRHNLLEFTRTRKKRTSYHVHQCWGASLESTAIDSLKRSGEKTRSRSLGNLWQKRRPRFSFFAKNARFPCFLCTSYLVPGTRYVVKMLDFQRSSEYQSSGYQPSWLLVPCELAGLSPFAPPRHPEDWRDSVLLATKYPVDWRDSVLLATRYPVDWRDSVLSAPRYPVHWRDSVLFAPQVPWGLAAPSPFSPKVPCAPAGLSTFCPPGTLELAGFSPLGHQVPYGLAGLSPFSPQVPCAPAGLSTFCPPGTLGTGGTQSFQPQGTLWAGGTQSLQPPRYTED